MTIDPEPVKYSPSELFDIQVELKRKCTCTDVEGACYLDTFGTKNDVISECRGKLGLLCGDQLQEKTFEILRTCVPDSMEISATKERQHFQYRIKGNKVCKNTFLCLYNISNYSWRTFSNAIKSKGSADVCPRKILTWKDDHVHDYSYNELNDIYEENLQETLDGKFVDYYFLFAVIASVHKLFSYDVQMSPCW